LFGSKRKLGRNLLVVVKVSIASHFGGEGRTEQRGGEEGGDCLPLCRGLGGAV
jgi:hypothetical protein